MPKEKVEVTPPLQTNIYKYLFFALLFIFLAVSLTTLGYLLGTKKEPPVKKALKPAATKTPVATSSAKFLDTSDWLTYVNQRYNFSVKYPPYYTLTALSSEDNPFTEDFVEQGDEGTMIGRQDKDIKPGETQSPAFVAFTQVKSTLPLAEYVKTKGHELDMCQEDVPAKTEEFTTESGLKGIKAWYYSIANCAGPSERHVKDPVIYFDARPASQGFIELLQNEIAKEFDTIAYTFKFIPPNNYGD